MIFSGGADTSSLKQCDIGNGCMCVICGNISIYVREGMGRFCFMDRVWVL